MELYEFEKLNKKYGNISIADIYIMLAKLEADKAELMEAAKSFQELNVCYRLGKRPSEKLFKKLEKANELIQKMEEM